MQPIKYRVLVRVDDPLSADDAIACAILALTPQQARQLVQAIDHAKELLQADLGFHHLALWNDSLEWYGNLPLAELRDALTGEPVEEALETGYAVLENAAFNSSAPQRMECATIRIYPDSLFWDAIPRDCDRHAESYSVPHELVRAFVHTDVSEVRRHLRELRSSDRSNVPGGTAGRSPAGPQENNSES